VIHLAAPKHSAVKVVVERLFHNAAGIAGIPSVAGTKESLSRKMESLAQVYWSYVHVLLKSVSESCTRFLSALNCRDEQQRMANLVMMYWRCSSHPYQSFLTVLNPAGGCFQLQVTEGDGEGRRVYALFVTHLYTT